METETKKGFNKIMDEEIPTKEKIIELEEDIISIKTNSQNFEMEFEKKKTKEVGRINEIEEQKFDKEINKIKQIRKILRIEEIEYKTEKEKKI